MNVIVAGEYNDR